MRIAIPYEGGAVCRHFGHAEQFRLYDTDDETRQITGEQTAGANGSGHGEHGDAHGHCHEGARSCSQKG